MKISIPSFLLSSFLLFLLGVSIFTYITFFEIAHIEEFPSKETIGFLILYLIAPAIIFLLIKFFKLIVLKEDEIVIIYPLKFKVVKHSYSDILKVNWGG